MYSSTNRGGRSRMALLAVLQAILLLTTLVFAPLSVLAQEDALASHDPAAAEQQSDPAPEQPAEPEEPGPTVKKAEKSEPAPRTAEPKKAAPALEPLKVEPKAEPVEPEMVLVIHPKVIKLEVGGVKKKVRAYECPAGDASPFGADSKPSADDLCKVVNVDWIMRDESVARASKDKAKKIRVFAGDEPGRTRLIAKRGDMKAKIKIKIRAAETAVAPAVDELVVSDLPQVELPKVELPKVEEPTEAPAEDIVVEEPTEAPAEDIVVEEPTEAPAEDIVVEEPTEAPAEDIVVEEPTEAPAEDIVVEEPTEAPAEDTVVEEPTEAPAEDTVVEEPTEAPAEGKPVAEEPANDCIIDLITGECVVDPLADALAQPEATEEPIVEAPAAPKATKATRVAPAAVEQGQLVVRKGGYRNGTSRTNIAKPLDGATFEVKNGSTTTTGQTVGGQVSVNLDPDTYTVTEKTAPSGWNIIPAIAYGSGSNTNQSNQTYHYDAVVQSGQTTTTPVFVNRKDNNTVPKACGLKIALLLDESGSTSEENGTLRSAAKDFVDVFKGTPTEFRVFSFSWLGREESDGSWDSVLSSTTAVHQDIDKVNNPDGGTNWDSAFRTVAALAPDAQVVVKVSDGNPTTYGDSQNYEGGTVHLADVEAGILSANSLKALPSKPTILAIGVGQAVSNPTNLVLVSGPGDAYAVGDWDELGQALKKIALELCGGSITVVKEVPDGKGGWTPESGWQYEASSNPAVAITSEPANGKTNGGGAVNFNFALTGDVTATVKETDARLGNGWSLVTWAGDKNAKCVTNQGANVTVDNNAADNGVKLTLGNNDVITCTFRNEPTEGKLTLTKKVDNNHGGKATPDQFGISVDGTPVTSGVANTYTANKALVLDEVGLKGYEFVSLTGDDACPDALKGTVTLKPGDDVECIITNQDIAPKLTLTKKVNNNNGGDAKPDQFGISVDGTPVTSGATNTYVANKALVIDEVGLKGYEFVEITGDQVCPDALKGTVTLQPGDDVDCTIVNQDIGPKLTLTKKVDNNHGGDAKPDQFGISVDGTPVTSGVANTYTANKALVLDEVGLKGYEFVSLTGDDACPDALKGTVTLKPGDDVECIITNQDIAPKLTLTKKVNNNNGGDAKPDQFGISVDGTPVTSGATNTYVANKALVIDEVGLKGYEFVEITGDQVCPDALKGTVTLQPGDDVDCTIVNQDIGPKLTLTKKVDNNHGGDAKPDQFGISVDGTPVTSGVANTYTANKALVLDEVGLKGYEFVSLTGDDACPDALKGTVTLKPGDDVECIITNQDIAPKLTLTKKVNNNNGGDAKPDQFGISVDGTPVTSGATNTYVANKALVIDEVGLKGYEFVEITGDQVCPDALKGTVTLQPGDDVDCTIVNQDIGPKLTLTKKVDNNHGGDAKPDQFGISVDGTPVTSGVANTYTANKALVLDEVGLKGYEFVSLTGDDACPDALKGTVTLKPGDDVECIITNQDIAPKLTLTKKVNNNNGGDAKPDQFGISVDGTPVTSGATNTYVANKALVIDEVGLKGYEFVEITGDQVCPDALKGTVTLQPGDDVDCTIVNQDIGPKLTLTKKVDNNHGGKATPDQFGISVDGTPVTSGVANTYTANKALVLDEVGLKGYEFVSLTGDDACPDALKGTVTLKPGDDVECIITNQDIAPKLTLTKAIVGGPGELEDFIPYIDQDEVEWAVANELKAGVEYTASEVMDIPDYVAGDWTGACAADGTVTLAVGDELTCEVTNYHAALKITKTADPEFYDEVDDLITYTITATNVGQTKLTDVDVTDKFPGGLDDFSCVLDDAPGDKVDLPVELGVGDSVICTATHSITEADLEAGQVYNQACADADEVRDEVCDDETVLRSQLTIVKKADREYYSAVGDVINYTVTATNAGKTALTKVDVTDDLTAVGDLDNWVCKLNGAGAPLSFPVPTLAIADQIICTASYTIVAGDMDVPPGKVLNAACADSVETAKVCDDVETPVAKLKIVKEASTDQYAEAGEKIEYTITATNIGVAALTDVDITDSLLDGLPWTCTVGSDEVTLPVDKLLSGQAIECTATYTTTPTDVENGQVYNQACVDSDQVGDAPDLICDEVTVDRIAVDLIKDVDKNGLPWPGGTFNYTLTIQNLSVVPVEITTLTDTQSGIADGFAACDPGLMGTILEPYGDDGDTATCNYSVDHWDTGIYPNTAEVIVTDAKKRTATDKDEKAVEVPKRSTQEIDITLKKVPFVDGEVVDSVESGTEVTFVLTFSHTVTSTPIYLYELWDDPEDDNLLDSNNPNIKDNTCEGLYGTVVEPNVDHKCQFTVELVGDLDTPHKDTAHIKVTDVNPLVPPPGITPRFAEAKDDATVKFIGGGGKSTGGGKSQPPTDMLLVTDSLSAATDDGEPFGGPFNWAIWLMLSALTIVSAGWIIRHQRLAEVRNRR